MLKIYDAIRLTLARPSIHRRPRMGLPGVFKNFKQKLHSAARAERSSGFTNSIFKNTWQTHPRPSAVLAVLLSVSIATAAHAAEERQLDDYTYPVLYQMDVFVDEYNAHYAPVALGASTFESMIQQVRSFLPPAISVTEYMQWMEKIQVFEDEKRDHNKIWAQNRQAAELNQKANSLAEAFFKYQLNDINFMIIYIINEYLKDPTRMDGWLRIMQALQQHKFSPEQMQQYAKQSTKTFQWTQGFEYTSFAALLLGALAITRGRGIKVYKHLVNKVKKPIAARANKKTSAAAATSSAATSSAATDAAGTANKKTSDLDQAFNSSFKRAKAQLDLEQQARQARQALQKKSTRSLRQKIRSATLGPSIKNMLALSGLSAAGGFTNLGFQQLYKKTTGQEWSLRNLPLNPMEYKQNYADALATLSLECRAHQLWQSSQGLQNEMALLEFGKQWNQLFLEKYLRLRVNPYYLQKRQLPQEVKINSSTGEVQFQLDQHQYSFNCPMLKQAQAASAARPATSTGMADTAPAQYFTSIEATLRYLYQARQKVEQQLMAQNKKARSNRQPAQNEYGQEHAALGDNPLNNPRIQHLFIKSLARRLAYLLGLNHAAINSMYQCLKATRNNVWQVKSLQELMSKSVTQTQYTHRARHQQRAALKKPTPAQNPVRLNQQECEKKIHILLNNIQLGSEVVKKYLGLHGLMRPSTINRYLQLIQDHMQQAIYKAEGQAPLITCKPLLHLNSPVPRGALSAGSSARAFQVPRCDIWSFNWTSKASAAKPLLLSDVDFGTPKSPYYMGIVPVQLSDHGEFQSLGDFTYSPAYIERHFFDPTRTLQGLPHQLESMCHKISHQVLFRHTSKLYPSIVPEYEFNAAADKIGLSKDTQPKMQARTSSTLPLTQHNSWAYEQLCPYFKHLRFDSAGKRLYFDHQQKNLSLKEQKALYVAASFMRVYLSSYKAYSFTGGDTYGFKQVEQKLIDYITKTPYVVMLPSYAREQLIFDNQLQQRQHLRPSMVLPRGAQDYLREQGAESKLILKAGPETLVELEKLYKKLLHYSHEKKQDHAKTVQIVERGAQEANFFAEGRVLKMFQHEEVVNDLINNPTVELRHAVDDFKSFEPIKQHFEANLGSHELIVTGAMFAGSLAMHGICSFTKIPQAVLKFFKAGAAVINAAKSMQTLVRGASAVRRSLPTFLKKISAETLMCLNISLLPLDYVWIQGSIEAYDEALQNFVIHQNTKNEDGEALPTLANLEHVNSARSDYIFEFLMLPLLTTPWVITPTLQALKNSSRTAGQALAQKLTRGASQNAAWQKTLKTLEHPQFFTQWKKYRIQHLSTP